MTAENETTKNTQLRLASENGELAKVRELLAAGVDPNAEDEFGYMALHRAADDRRYRYSRIVEMLLVAGADPNVADQYGDQLTPLHFASSSGSEDSVRMLLAAGADPKAEDSQGQTPLHKADRSGDIVRMLLEAGADPKAKDRDGLTPLLVFLDRVASRSENIVNWLESEGANRRNVPRWLANNIREDIEAAKVLLATDAYDNEKADQP